MPPVVAVVAAVIEATGVAVGVSATSAAFAAFTVFAAQALIGIGFSVGLSKFSHLLQKKPTPGSLLGSGAARLLSGLQAAAPRRVIYGTVLLGGIVTFRQVDRTRLDLVFTIAGHQVAGIDKIFFNGEEQVRSDYSTVSGIEQGGVVGRLHGSAFYEKALGASAEPAFPLLNSYYPDLWTANHLQAGCAKVHLRLEEFTNPPSYPSGVPNPTFLVRGKLVFDPRDGGQSHSDPTTWTFSNNAALCIADYLCDSDIGLGADYATEIDEDALIAAANVCDEAQVINASPLTTEKRYTIDGAFDTTEQPGTILEQMSGAMAGYITYIGGKWVILPGAFRLPVDPLITDGDIVAPMKLTTKRSRRDLFNGVRGTFIDPTHNWQETDFPVISNATYVSEDGGAIWKNVFYPFTISPYAAQRIAKIDLERIRRQVSSEITMNMKGYNFQPGDVVEQTHSRFGWSDKTFEVQSMNLAQISGGLGVSLVLTESDVDIYGFTVDEYGEPVATDDLELLGTSLETHPLPWYPGTLPFQFSDDFLATFDRSWKLFTAGVSYQARADGGNDGLISLSGKMPVNEFSPSLVSRPKIKISSSAATGGYLKGGTVYHFILCAVDADGHFSLPSRLFSVVVPAGTDTNTITLSDFVWPSGTQGWVIFGGTTLINLSFQGNLYGAFSLPAWITKTGSDATPDTITILGDTDHPVTGIEITARGLPDPKLDHFNIKAKYVLHGGVAGTTILATYGASSSPPASPAIKIDPAGFTLGVNEFAGRYIWVVGHALVTPAIAFKIASNTADGICTLDASAPDPTTNGISVGDVVVISTLVTGVGSNSTGNYIEDSLLANSYFTGGMVASGEKDNVVRIIAGTGVGQFRRIIENTATRIYISGDWEITPDTSSKFIIEQNGWPVSQATSSATNAIDPHTYNPTLVVPNVARSLMLVMPITATQDGIESAEEHAPWRLIWVEGQAGTGVGDSAIAHY